MVCVCPPDPFPLSASIPVFLWSCRWACEDNPAVSRQPIECLSRHVAKYSPAGGVACKVSESSEGAVYKIRSVCIASQRPVTVLTVQTMTKVLTEQTVFTWGAGPEERWLD